MSVIDRFQSWLQGTPSREKDALPGGLSLEELRRRDTELQHRLDYLRAQVDILQHRKTYLEQHPDGR